MLRFYHGRRRNIKENGANDRVRSGDFWVEAKDVTNYTTFANLIFNCLVYSVLAFLHSSQVSCFSLRSFK